MVYEAKQITSLVFPGKLFKKGNAIRSFYEANGFKLGRG